MTFSHFRKLRAMPWRDKLLLAEAVVLLGLARLSVLIFPFRWLVAANADESVADSWAGLDERERASIERVRWTVGVASRHTPWNCNCLTQALAARRMLTRRQVESTLHLGVRKDDRGQLEAHAWLRCGDMHVTGQRGHERYAVVGTFFG